jgi:hypothetical protein
MNRVLLTGRLYGEPLQAKTTAGEPVATVHVEPSDGSCRFHGHESCRGVPCIVSPEQLRLLQGWHAEGRLLSVEGFLTREILWYGEYGGRCTLQVRVTSCSATDTEPTPEGELSPLTEAP